MNLITKLPVLHSSKISSQLLKSSVTHKVHESKICNADFHNHQNRSRSLSNPSIKSFGKIEVQRRCYSPNTYSYLSKTCGSNKFDLSDLQKFVTTNRAKSPTEERQFSTLQRKKTDRTGSSTSIRQFSKFKDTIKNWFVKKSNVSDNPVVQPYLEPAELVPNIKMKIVPYSSDSQSTKVETSRVDFEKEQKRKASGIPYLNHTNTKKLMMDVSVKPKTKHQVDKVVKEVKPHTKTQRVLYDHITVEAICPFIETKECSKKSNRPPTVKHVPFQSEPEEEAVTEPKANTSKDVVVSIADICNQVNNAYKRNKKSSHLTDKDALSSPVGKKQLTSGNQKKKLELTRKPSPLQSEKVKTQKLFATINNPFIVQSSDSKIEPTHQELSNIYCYEDSNVEELPYENYSTVYERTSSLFDEDIFSQYEPLDYPEIENINEIKKYQTTFKLPKPLNLVKKKAFATSYDDLLKTQLLCSKLFSSHSSKLILENLQPFQIKSLITQTSFNLSDLEVMSLVVDHDKEKQRVDWENYKNEMYNLKIDKASKSKQSPKSAQVEKSQSTALDSSVKVNSGIVSNVDEEEENDAEIDKKITAEKGVKNPKLITFIKKSFHTISSPKYYTDQKMFPKRSFKTKVASFSRKSKRGKINVMFLPDKEVKPKKPCDEVEEIINRCEKKRGNSLMRHTEWKAVPIKGDCIRKDPMEECKKLDRERELYKQMILERSKTRKEKKPKKLITSTPFDKEEKTFKKAAASPPPPPTKIVLPPNKYEPSNKVLTKVVFLTSSNTVNDCACVRDNYKHSSKSIEEYINPIAKLKCSKTRCINTKAAREESQEKLKKILDGIEDAADKLKKAEKLRRKNKDYNKNFDTIRSRNKYKDC